MNEMEWIKEDVLTGLYLGMTARVTRSDDGSWSVFLADPVHVANGALDQVQVYRRLGRYRSLDRAKAVIWDMGARLDEDPYGIWVKDDFGDLVGFGRDIGEDLAI